MRTSADALSRSAPSSCCACSADGAIEHARLDADVDVVALRELREGLARAVASPARPRSWMNVATVSGSLPGTAAAISASRPPM